MMSSGLLIGAGTLLFGVGLARFRFPRRLFPLQQRLTSTADEFDESNKLEI